MVSIDVIKGSSTFSPKPQTTTLHRQVHKGRPMGYEAALARVKPVSPAQDKAGVAIGYADLIDGNDPTVFATFTYRPEGIDEHGRPVFVGEWKARKLRDTMLDAIAGIQGFPSDWVCFQEQQRNGNYHHHLAMSNVNLSRQEFAPIRQRRDKHGFEHLCLRGLERKADAIMGRANFRIWGDNGLTASYYLSRDLLKQDRDGSGVEFSAHYGDHNRKRKQLAFVMSDWIAHLKAQVSQGQETRRAS